jgi:cytochrome P450
VHELHRLRQGALNPFFSQCSILSIQPLIADKIARLYNKLQQHLAEKKPIELRKTFSSMTLGVILHYYFGESWDTFENDKLATE